MKFEVRGSWSWLITNVAYGPDGESLGLDSFSCLRKSPKCHKRSLVEVAATAYTDGLFVTAKHQTFRVAFIEFRNSDEKQGGGDEKPNQERRHESSN